MEIRKKLQHIKLKRSKNDFENVDWFLIR